MPYQASFGSISAAAPLEPPRPDSPLRIGILADFSGRQNRGILGSPEDIATRKFHRVNRENLDEIMAALSVQLQLTVDGESIALSFVTLDDFLPDAIHDRVELIADAYGADEKSTLMSAVVHHPDFQA